MLARVVTIRVRPEKMDECVRIFRERNAPAIAAQPGFDHGHGWVDRASGRATSVTFWTNEADERASRANIAGLVERMADVLASDEVDQEICEVVHDQYSPGQVEPSTGTAASHRGGTLSDRGGTS